MRFIVIGGGAAGFFCAVTAARLHPGAEVIILEKTGKLLSKVRISGGGRCNVTHACFSIPEMVKNYPRGQHFVKKTFHQFFTNDTIGWFAERGVNLNTEADGRMFPVTNSSETIINCLLKEADKYRVQVIMNTSVERLEKTREHWIVHTSREAIINVDAVCVACGGYAKTVQFDWLRMLGHSVQTPVPSLFTFNMPEDGITKLMGVSLTGRVRIKGTKFDQEGPILITHWGLSGPAILKLSSRAARELAAMNYQFQISVNWCVLYSSDELKELFYSYRNIRGNQFVRKKNDLGIPQRLWEYLCSLSGVSDDVRWADLPAAIQAMLIRNLLSQEFTISGKTTYKEEFVTAGGIVLSEIDPNTMQSRKVEGLFFAGEVMDVDGVTGGFNFQHAWTSGWIAGSNLGLKQGVENSHLR